MKNKLKKLILTITILCTAIIIPLQCSAHSGRTDSNGGHKDNQNKSGLGPYHYHCGGHPAHLHKNGVCPYSGNTKTNTGTSTKSTQSIKSQSQVPKTINIESIVISSSTKQLIEGESVQLTAQITPQNATNKSILWTSSDSQIASIDETGKLTALSAGTVTITATSSNSIKATIEITITKKPKLVEKIIIDNSNITMTVNDELTLNAKIEPEDADEKELNFSSKNADIVKVVDNKLVAVSTGKIEIYVNSKDGNAISVCEVEVINVEKSVDNNDKSIDTESQNVTHNSGKNIAVGVCVIWIASLCGICGYEYYERRKTGK